MNRLLQASGKRAGLLGLWRTCLLISGCWAACCQVGTAFGQAINVPQIDVPKTQPTPISPTPITSPQIQLAPIAPTPVPPTPITVNPITTSPIQSGINGNVSAPIYRLPALGSPGLNSGGTADPTARVLVPGRWGVLLPASTNAADTNATAAAVPAQTPSTSADQTNSQPLDAFLRFLYETNEVAPVPAGAPVPTNPFAVPAAPEIPPDSGAPDATPSRVPDTFIYPV
jgi:hypothetical protein